MNTTTDRISVHSPEALRDARDIGEARKDSALIRTEQRHQVAVWRFQRDLLARILQVGSATTDDLAPDLRRTFKKNAGNWRGAAVRRLVTDRIIKAAGMTKCRRASRHGSPLTQWEAVDVAAVKDRLAYLDRLIGSFDQPPPDSVASPASKSEVSTDSHRSEDTGQISHENQHETASTADFEADSVLTPRRATQPLLPGLVPGDAGELWRVEPTIPSRREGR